jgi:molybdenum cofactor biosynthesis enzyme MoaA
MIIPIKSEQDIRKMHPNVPPNNQWSMNAIPRNRDLKLTVPYTCNAPSRHLLVDTEGECFVCGCEAWLPISVGKITDFAQLEEIWAHPIAQQLQADIDAGTFDYCAVTRCGVSDRDMISEEYTISINIDQSCNLRCPSCRKDAIMLGPGDNQYDNKLRATEHLVSLLEKFTQPCRIIMCGNGDPLASSIMRPLIHKFKPKPNQWIKLFTNGLLLRKQLTDNPVLEHINEYLISIDAGSAEVYEKVRLGGKWEILLDNFKFLQTAARAGANISVTLVVQQANYMDIENYCNLAVEYGFSAGITKLEDWGTWADFNYQNVLDPAHPENADAVQAIRAAYNKFNRRIGFAPGVKQAIGVM